MKNYNERTPDAQYQNLLKQILENGRSSGVIQGEDAIRIVGLQLRYDMNNGFPLITERDMSGGMLKAALGEHIAFLNGATTQSELEKFGCKFWSRWVTEEKCATFGLPPGDLGPGSYGAAWAAFPTPNGPFNQVVNLQKQIQQMPYLRTHVLTPWIPEYTLQHKDLKRKVVVAPCHGYVHVITYPEQKEFAIHHFQRSGDMPVGVPFNMIQYAAFGLMLEKLMPYWKFVEYVHTFSDPHIYTSQIDKVKELVAREPRKLPTVRIDEQATKDIKDIRDFRPEHFIVEDYNPHPKMTIPTPV